MTTAAELDAALATIGYPAILKTTTGGYDGHGQQDLNQSSDVVAAQALLAQGPCILEQRQTFKRELSLMVTRDAAGVVRPFPVVENRHRNHILQLTVAPAPARDARLQEQLTQLATTIANAIQLRGVWVLNALKPKQGLWSMSWRRGRIIPGTTALKLAASHSLRRTFAALLGCRYLPFNCGNRL